MTDTTDADRWHHHLAQLLTERNMTVIVGGASRNGSLSLQVSGGPPDALLWLARSLVEQAQERAEQVAELCQQVLDILPDPNA